MSGLTLWLVLGMLLLPTIGALVARAIEQRSGGRAVKLIGALGFAGAVACLLALQWRPIDAATLGRLNIFLPSSDIVVAQDSFVEIPTVAPTTRIVTPSITPTRAPTSTPTIATAAPTATSEPTPTTPPPPTEIPPTEAPAPTEAPPAPTEAPAAGPQRYIVESGDTLRSIAERFNVSVGAILRYNGLSEEDGDSLRPGQELLIPPP